MIEKFNKNLFLCSVSYKEVKREIIPIDRKRKYGEVMFRKNFIINKIKNITVMTKLKLIFKKFYIC